MLYKICEILSLPTIILSFKEGWNSLGGSDLSQCNNYFEKKKERKQGNKNHSE